MHGGNYYGHERISRRPDGLNRGRTQALRGAGTEPGAFISACRSFAGAGRAECRGAGREGAGDPTPSGDSVTRGRSAGPFGRRSEPAFVLPGRIAASRSRFQTETAGDAL